VKAGANPQISHIYIDLQAILQLLQNTTVVKTVLSKITFKVISDQNQNYLSKIALKSSSKSLACEVI